MKMNTSKTIIGAFAAFQLMLLPLSVQAAQVCHAYMAHTAPDSRYTDNGDGTVTDNVTGLMWKQCGEGLTMEEPPCSNGTALLLTWQGALQQVETVNAATFATYNDWRLPDRKELESLLELACYSPAINEALFPNTRTAAGGFWSSSPHATAGFGAWSVDFQYAEVYNTTKSDARYVRLVRGGRY